MTKENRSINGIKHPRCNLFKQTPYEVRMRGFLSIPQTMYVKGCSQCGARPVIALLKVGEYTVKCPINDNHYHTEPGLIDLEDWNRHNQPQPRGGYSLSSAIAV